MLVNSIQNGLYVRRMIIKPNDQNCTPRVAESTHEQTDDELAEKKQSKWKLMIRLFRLFSWVFQKTSMLQIKKLSGSMNGKILALQAGNRLNLTIINVNQNGNGNVVAAQAEDNGNGNNGNQIRCYNCRGVSH
ncbi:hypothetical protein Tco_1444701 [Tanacetum coccineum]